MYINDMEKALKEKNLLVVHYQGTAKHYINGQSLFANGHFINRKDVFGIYQNDDGKYYFFITDSERGIPFYGNEYATENDACQALIDDILLLSEISAESSGQ